MQKSRKLPQMGKNEVKRGLFGGAQGLFGGAQGLFGGARHPFAPPGSVLAPRSKSQFYQQLILQLFIPFRIT